MTDEDWQLLLSRIKEGKCTPFLGAGVNYGILPLGGQVAREWAQADHFPLSTSDDLASVAQFIAVKYDPMRPKEMILKRLRDEKPPDFTQPDDRLECLRALAELPLPVYLTTNYDDLIVQALKHTQPPKNPRREVCKWNDELKRIPTVFSGKYKPDHANPVVFYLHGSDQFVQSLVLTEDDYLDFLVNISTNQKILPARIQEALTDASLLFIGYRLRDINFRVIYRGLVEKMTGSLRRLSVTVQVTPPDDHSGNPAKAEEYLTKYFEKLEVRVLWGTAADFAKQLRERWRLYGEPGTSNP
jgi:hypothetical protein